MSLITNINSVHRTRIIQVPVVATDNAVAMAQMEVAYTTLMNRPVVNITSLPNLPDPTKNFSLDNKSHPRIVTFVEYTRVSFTFLTMIYSLGGDHSVVLPNLRALNKVYGPVSVIHFDAHIDTWKAEPEFNSTQAGLNHGTFFYVAKQEGLLRTENVHGGIRAKMNVYISPSCCLACR